MNYCDYDLLYTYPTGQFSSQHKSQINDCIVEIEKNTAYKDNIIQSFLNGKYKTYKTVAPIILYRIFGTFKCDLNNPEEKSRGALVNGAFTSTEFAESIIDAKIRFALDPQWKNTKMYEVKILVPKNTIISIGVVAPIKLKTGTILPGGAEQVLLPFKWPLKWIIGVRRVTNRQLQIVPEYPIPRKKLKDIICTKKSNLYQLSCPLCGNEQIVQLSKHEKFLVTGAKGNKYLMRFHCMNKKCDYYW